MVDTREAFDDVAQDYDDLYAEFYAGMKEILGAQIYKCEHMGRVLDIGGGGKCPEDLFSDECVSALRMFVSSDISLAMLSRNKNRLRVNSDAFSAPFRAGAFDAILVQGCIHHIGHERYGDRLRRVRAFLEKVSELLSDEGRVYIEEPTLPFFFEQIERWLLFPLSRFVLRKPAVPIYMCRSSELSALLHEVFDCEKILFKRTGEVVGSPWKMSSPFVFLKWFRFPVCLIPYRYLLCRGKLKTAAVPTDGAMAAQPGGHRV